MNASAHKPTVHERILLVDDSRSGLSVRKVVLEELGYTVTGIGCSLEAWKKFCSESFDLVVTGYGMPNLNGIDLIARMRECKPEVPIVLVSGVAEALGLDAKNTGADAVVQKNAHEDSALKRAVLRLLSRKTRRKPAHSQRAASARARVARVVKR